MDSHQQSCSQTTGRLLCFYQGLSLNSKFAGAEVASSVGIWSRSLEIMAWQDNGSCGGLVLIN